MNRDKLEKYLISGMTTRSIAKKFGKGQTTVRYWMKKYGLKPNFQQKCWDDKLEKIIGLVPMCVNMSDLCRKLDMNPAGNSYQSLRQLLIDQKIDISHFRFNYGKSPELKFSWEKILVYNRLNGKREKSRLLRRAMIEYGFNFKICSVCNLESKWNGMNLNMEIDHIDGDSVNNVPYNLRFICPNCHSQTETYCKQ